ncbi:Chondroitin sulfate ABC exolyase precursor [compost metagenome]
MYQKVESTLSMAVTDPDLGFYDGPDDSPLTESGKRKEVSIYSRSWYRSPAKPSVVKLLIRGGWMIKGNEQRLKADLRPDGNTMLSINCKDGLVSSIELVKRNDKERVK